MSDNPAKACELFEDNIPCFDGTPVTLRAVELCKFSEAFTTLPWPKHAL
jgi:hypothetical protein